MDVENYRSNENENRLTSGDNNASKSGRTRENESQTMEYGAALRIGLAAVLGLIAAAGNLIGGYFVVRRDWPRIFLQYFLALSAG